MILLLVQMVMERYDVYHVHRKVCNAEGVAATPRSICGQSALDASRRVESAESAANENGANAVYCLALASTCQEAAAPEGSEQMFLCSAR